MRLPRLQHGEDVASRVLEPSDVGSPGPVDALAVLLEAVVPLEGHPTAGQVIDSLVDVVNWEVEDRVDLCCLLIIKKNKCVPVAGEV